MKIFTQGILIAAFTLMLCINTYSQFGIKYLSAEHLTMIGKAKLTDSIYQRIDSAEAAPMPKAVRELAKQSAGIAVMFETNSTTIHAKWKLAAEVYLSNMTPIGHSGLDLYCFRNNKWQYVNVGKPTKGIIQEQRLIENMDSSMKQFILYLPLYNGVSELEIGVEENAVLQSPSSPAVDVNRRVVVYGSSIVQGASASRPGMAYPAMLQRKTGLNVINLGFSGNAKMEKELAEYLSTIPAECYVLDCIPNPSPEEIKERSYTFIKLLREKRPVVPIILVETVFRENGNWDLKAGQRIANQNKEIRKTYDRLMKEGMKGLYYIESSKLIGNDHEATVDGVHLSDLGFTRIVNALLPLIQKAMKENKVVPVYLCQ